MESTLPRSTTPEQAMAYYTKDKASLEAQGWIVGPLFSEGDRFKYLAEKSVSALAERMVAKGVTGVSQPLTVVQKGAFATQIAETQTTLTKTNWGWIVLALIVLVVLGKKT